MMKLIAAVTGAALLAGTSCCCLAWVRLIPPPLPWPTAKPTASTFAATAPAAASVAGPTTRQPACVPSTTVTSSACASSLSTASPTTSASPVGADPQSPPQQACAMPRLRRRCGNLAADRDALARRQRGRLLDLCDQQVESPLRVRLDKLQPRKGGREGFDVIAVLHFVEPIFRRAFFRTAVPRVVVAPQRGRDLAGIGTGMKVDRQKAVHGAGYSDERSLDPSGGGERRNICANVGTGQAVDVDVGAGAGNVSVVGGVQSLLPLA